MSILKGYPPSSLFTMGYLVFVYCSVMLLSKWVLCDNSSGSPISHPYSRIGLTRASKSLFLIVIVVVSELENNRFTVARTL